MTAPVVLLTGASGFLGQYCLRQLRARGCRVLALSHARVLPAESPDVIPLQLDLHDPSALAQTLSHWCPTHLLHLAWDTTPGRYWQSPDNLRWVQSSLQLLTSFAAAGGQRIVIAGSCAEYDLRFGYCDEVLTPRTPETFYGQSKHALHLLSSGWAQQMGLSLAWMHIFYLYGGAEAPGRLVSSALQALRQQQPLDCSHGRQFKDFVYVADAARALVELLLCPAEGCFNLASGAPITVRELLETLMSCAQAPVELRFGVRPAAPSDAPFVAGNPARLRAATGWEPAFSHRAALSEILSEVGL